MTHPLQTPLPRINNISTWVTKEFKDLFATYRKVSKMSSSFHSKGATYSRGAIGFFFLLIEPGKGSRTLNKGVQTAFLLILDNLCQMLTFTTKVQIKLAKKSGTCCWVTTECHVSLVQFWSKYGYLTMYNWSTITRVQQYILILACFKHFLLRLSTSSEKCNFL